MFHNHHSAPQGRPSITNGRLPGVAEDAQQAPEEQEPTAPAAADLAVFKVFLKRNLRPQAPPADLLAGIRARLDDLSAEK